MHVPSMVEIGVRHLPARFGRGNSENADVEIVEELLTSINTIGLNTSGQKHFHAASKSSVQHKLSHKLNKDLHSLQTLDIA